MLTINSTATEKIKGIMVEQGAEDASLRIMVTGMGCGGPQYMMTLEKEAKEDDTVIQSDGVTILVDQESTPFLEGATLDYVEGLEHTGFTIHNPTLAGGGGCGSPDCACGHGH
ncbi:MAG: iron-sulfur cluster assembly accessory protein [Dehalococcoidia bacterium]